MKSFLRNGAYRLTAKKIDESALDVSRIELGANKLNFFSLSTNPIISFTHGDKLWYFRECPPLYNFYDFTVKLKRPTDTVGRLPFTHKVVYK